jgi:hypothetical protein
MAVVQYTFTHKQYIQQHNRHTKKYIEEHNSVIRKSVSLALLCKVYPAICLRTEKIARKNLRVAGERQLAKSIQNRAYLSIRIHKHNNKNK